MSVQAITLALELQGVSPSEKLLLLVLANYADKSNRCFPSHRTLAADSCLSERTILRLMKDLEDRRLLTREERRRADGSRTSDEITLHLGGGDMVSPTPGVMVSPGVGTSTALGGDMVSPPTTFEPRHNRQSEPLGAAAPKRGTRIAADWSLPDEGRSYAIDKGIDPAAVDDLAEQFHNHWLARAGSKGVMLDWAACWRTWVGNDIKWRKERSNGSGTQSTAGQRGADRRENIGNLFEGVVEAVNRRR